MGFVADAPAGRFVPDGDPKSVPDSAPSVPISVPEAPASLAQKVEGGLEAGVGLAQGLVGGAAGQVAAVGSGFMPGNYGTPEGAARAQGTGAKVREWIQNLFTPGAKGKEYLEKIAHAIDASKVAGMGPAFGSEMMGLTALPGGARASAAAAAVSPEAEAVRKAAGKVSMGAKDAAKTATTFGGDLVGAKVKPAKAEATGAARGAVAAGAEDLSKQGADDALRAKAMGDVTARLDSKTSGRAEVPNLDSQGSEIRDTFTQAMDGAKKARAERADSEFEQVKQMALEKEALGERVNTAPIEGELTKTIETASGIPDLETGLKKMLSAVASGKTFEQLELARRYLNDVGYSSELEGFPAIVRSQARHTAQAIDRAMQEFVPEFGAYKDNYRKMSEPLESLTTRFGKAVAGTEGGMGENAYSKVANSDLPSRLFSRKEGIDILVDALAGGKNAEPAARKQAEMHVSAMVTNWVMESVRQKDPKAALEHLQSPQMRGTLSALPGVEKAMKKAFGDLSGMQRTSDELKRLGKEVAARGKGLSDAGEKMKTQLAMADELARQPGKTSQKKAFDAYVSALDGARKADAIPEAQYRATLELIDRAQTLEEKSALARKVVGGIALAAGGFKAATYLGF